MVWRSFGECKLDTLFLCVFVIPYAWDQSLFKRLVYLCVYKSTQPCFLTFTPSLIAIVSSIAP